MPLSHIARRPGRLITTASADVALKGLSYLLEAVAKLRTERDVTLTIIGKPRDGASNELIDHLGLRPHIEFVSGVPDERIVELYAEAELAVVPSLYEGFSLPAIEAMSTGICLVATDGGALPEVTGPDGEHRAAVPGGRRRRPRVGHSAWSRRRRTASASRRGRSSASRRALELEALRPADGRAVPRGAGDASQHRQAATGTAEWLPGGARGADHSPRSARRSAGRPRARCRLRLRPARLRRSLDREPTSSPSTTAPAEVESTGATFAAMTEAGEIAEHASPVAYRATRRSCPSPTARSTG